jgi:hypothetical protein
MIFGATAYAEVPYAGTSKAPVACTLAAYGAMMFGAFAYAGDDCPIVVPIPPKPPEQVWGGGGIAPYQPREGEKQKEPFNIEQDDEECILAALAAFSTYANTR